MTPTPIQLYLTFYVYVAALHAQRLARNAQKVQQKSWFRDLSEVRTWLAGNGMTL